MTTKQYLRQIRILDKHIDSKLEELSNLRSKVCNITASYSSQPRSSSSAGDKMASAIAKIVDLENEIALEIDQFVDMKQEINRRIAQLSDPAYGLLLNLRYMNQMSWQKISLRMNYDKSWVLRLHQRALTELSAMMDKSEAI